MTTHPARTGFTTIALAAALALAASLAASAAGEGERTREPHATSTEPKENRGGLATSLVADLAFFRITPGVPVLRVADSATTSPVTGTTILANPARLTIGDTELRIDGPSVTWNGQFEPGDSAIIRLGATTGVKQGSMVEILDETPIQYFEKRRDGAFDLRALGETPRLRASFRDEGFGMARLWLAHRLITRREPIEGVILDVGAPVLVGPVVDGQSVYTNVALRYTPDSWQGLLLPLEAEGHNEGHLLALVRLRKSSDPRDVPAVPAPPYPTGPKYSVETHFIHVPKSLDKKVFTRLLSLPGAIHRHGEACAFTGVTKSANGFVIALKDGTHIDLGAFPDAGLLSAPRLTTPASSVGQGRLAPAWRKMLQEMGCEDNDLLDMRTDGIIADCMRRRISYIEDRKWGLWPVERTFEGPQVGLTMALALIPSEEPYRIAVDLYSQDRFLSGRMPRGLEGLEAAKAAVQELLVCHDFRYEFEASVGEWVGFAYDASPKEGLMFVLCGIDKVEEGGPSHEGMRG